jgi:type I restriction enzyme S subunit
MSFPRYPKYKDSGVEWLGEVPEHWGVGQSRRLFALRNERASESDQQLTASQEHGVIFQEDFVRLEGRRVVQVIKGADMLKHVEPNDFVISMRSFQGGIEWCKLRGCISSAYVMLVPCERIHCGFFSYLLKSQTYIQALQTTSNLVRDGQALRYENFTKVNLPLVPMEEQAHVAEFLDGETGKIDELVAEQQRLMELLKEKRQAVISHAVTKGLNPRAPMKPSGIEWLGDVPEHWDVTRIKKLASMISKGTTPTTVGAEFTDDGVRFLKAENVTEMGVSAEPEFFISRESHTLLSRSSLDHGDVLVVIAGATTGKSAVLGASLLPANTNQAVSFIRPQDRKLSEHISLWLGTTMVRNLITLNSVQSAQPNLSMEDLGNLPLPLPPSEELETIRSYLTRENAKLDALAAEAQKAIDLLQERRTALISAAVTGQIDVRKLAAA